MQMELVDHVVIIHPGMPLVVIAMYHTYVAHTRHIVQHKSRSTHGSRPRGLQL
jgi:hypothetical protein